MRRPAPVDSTLRESLRANLVVAVAAALSLATSACRVEDAMPPTSSVAAADSSARESARLRAHLRTLPGVADASVVVSIAPADPFARTPAGQPPQPPRPARVAFVVATTAGADSGLIGDAAITAARTALGDDAVVDVQIAPAAPTPRLVSVGPFHVSADSRPLLLATLALGLVLVACLAGALALVLYRRGVKPHQSSTRTTRGS